MITSILCGLVGMFLFYKYSDVADYGFGFGEGVITLFVGFVSFLFGILIAMTLPVHYSTRVSETEIVSLKDNTQIQGRFHGNYLISSGYIEGGIGFTFYVKNEDTYRLLNIPTNLTKVLYDENTPTVIQKTRFMDDSFINYFALDSKIENENTYTLKVPKGTIKNTLMLDAQ